MQTRLESIWTSPEFFFGISGYDSGLPTGPVSPHRLIGSVVGNVLFEHDVLPCDLPFTVLDMGHLPDTQGYLGLPSEFCMPTQTFKKLWVVVVGL